MSGVFVHPGWTAAILAASLGLLLVPSAQWLAHWAGFVAVPRVAPHRKVAYLGGPAVAVAVLIGGRIAGAENEHVVLALALATVLGLVGLVDDHRPVPAKARLALQLIAAAVLVGHGGRLALSGSHTVDAALTVIWVVAVMNGVNFLDNSDALASCIVAASAVGIVLMSGSQTSVTVIAAAITGGCCAFCAFNARPASIYLGDAGSMFLGFLLPALTLELLRTASNPVWMTRPVIALLALPVIELAITVIRRVLHGRSFDHSAPDNISYAFVARGVPPAGTLMIHALAQCLLTGAAVLRFRGMLPPGTSVAVVATELVLLAVATRKAPVHGPDERGSRRTRVVLVAAGILVFVLAVLTTAAVALAMRSAEDGAAQVDRATAYLRSGDTAHARVAFLGAERSFAHAGRWLDNGAMRVTAAIPVVGQNLNAAQKMVVFGRALAHDGASFAGAVDPNGLHFRGGQLPIAEVRKYSPAVDVLAQQIASIEWRAQTLDDQMLVAPLSRKLDEFRTRLRSAADDTRNAADAARLVPDVFGGGAPRHYLVIAQNLAESRATGGIPGSFGYLDANAGRLDMSDFAPVDDLNAAAKAKRGPVVGTADFLKRYGQFEPQRFYENATMSPDFPTVASVLAQQYERDTGRPVDGVISLDPVALRALLRLTGPVRVTVWPAPITADNVIDVALRDEYTRFTDYHERKGFLGSVTREVWHAMRGRDLGGPSRIANALSQASSQRHLMLWLARPAEEQVLNHLGLAASVPAAGGDVFFSTVQNAGGSKLDLYTKRASSYDVVVSPADGTRASVRANATLTITNDAPANLPQFVAGPYSDPRAAFLRAFVSIYSGLGLDRVQIDGRTSSLVTDTEFGRSVYSTFVNVGRGTSARFQLALSGDVGLVDGWYTLGLLPQPAAGTDSTSIVIRVPHGRQIVSAEGCRIHGQSSCDVSGSAQDPRTVRVLIR